MTHDKKCQTKYVFVDAGAGLNFALIKRLFIVLCY